MLRRHPGGHAGGHEINCHEQTIREFLDTRAKRRSGALPAVDLTVECSSCGIRIIGDGLSLRGVVLSVNPALKNSCNAIANRRDPGMQMEGGLLKVTQGAS